MESPCYCPWGKVSLVAGGWQQPLRVSRRTAFPCPLQLCVGAGGKKRARGSCWGGKAAAFASHPEDFGAAVGVVLQRGAREAK